MKAAASGQPIQLLPGVAGAAVKVQFLAIVSDWYDDNNLSFTINNAPAAGVPTFNLDRPILCMGKGGVALFDTAPLTLYFTNTTGVPPAAGGPAPPAKDANIQILIGRDTP